MKPSAPATASRSFANYRLRILLQAGGVNWPAGEDLRGAVGRVEGGAVTNQGGRHERTSARVISASRRRPR